MSTSSHSSRFARIFRRWREVVTVFLGAIGVIANLDSVVRLLQTALAWLAHLRLP